mmetsp:Transcript_12283/g.30818  ORF Transcript_12283/g.30818 Transcript_12283/m.30818 type:complete len:246 (+) Transcript_12283:414-1151(+)
MAGNAPSMSISSSQWSSSRVCREQCIHMWDAVHPMLTARASDASRCAVSDSVMRAGGGGGGGGCPSGGAKSLCWSLTVHARDELGGRRDPAGAGVGEDAGRDRQVHCYHGGRLQGELPSRHALGALHDLLCDVHPEGTSQLGGRALQAVWHHVRAAARADGPPRHQGEARDRDAPRVCEEVEEPQAARSADVEAVCLPRSLLHQEDLGAAPQGRRCPEVRAGRLQSGQGGGASGSVAADREGEGG